MCEGVMHSEDIDCWCVVTPLSTTVTPLQHHTNATVFERLKTGLRRALSINKEEKNG
jgi:hypothetical protein